MATIRLFRHYIPAAYLYLAVVETLVFVAAFYLGVELRFHNSDAVSFEKILPLWPKASVYVVVMVICMIALGLYERQSRETAEGTLLRIGAGFILGFVPLTLIFYLAPSLYLGRGALGFSYLFALLGILVVRFLFRLVIDQNKLKRRVLVLGTGEQAGQIRRMRRSSDLRGIIVVGYVQMPGEVVVNDNSILHLDRPLPQFAREHEIDEIVVAMDDRRKAMPVHEILGCKMDGIFVIDLLTFFERELGKIRLDILNPSWMFFSDGFQRGVLRTYSKRLFDISASLVMLPFALPLMAITAIAIYLECGGQGSIIFRQVRVGESGKPFRIVKFRSMQEDAEKDGARWAQQNDSRVTRVGSIIRKIRLDELPQLFNVLKGDMSFVGPRPERPEFVDQLKQVIPYYNERHRVKPGLTGWAQICYQYGASEDDAFRKQEYDLYYVKNYSIFLDLLILVQTAEVVLMGKGAH